jgi:hypothetical protein
VQREVEAIDVYIYEAWRCASGVCGSDE